MILSATLAGCGSSAAPELPGRILYVAEREGLATVALLPASGGAPSLVMGGGTATYPGSPDPRGTHALVVTAADGARHQERLWLVPLPKGEATPLSPPAGKIRNPAWSPDGAWVVFESDAASFRDLYRVSRDGGVAERLTDAPNGSFEPSVSPDGRQLAFGTSRDGNAEIYVSGADGASPRRLTDHPGDDTHPAWSPAGADLAWIAHRDGAARVHLAAPDGSNARPLRALQGPAIDLDFAWSPDGRRLAVVEQTGPQDIDVVIYGNDGARLATLGGPGVDENPSWSPDGAWIAWTSSQNGNPDVWVAAADGARARAVTASAQPEWLPRWVR